ncbi:Fe-S protein assembly co-chaperone HscB [Aquabacterium sp. A08]|uniref:Fe-S protein assembly co-chaperone HscB n=1 Tax=Aquabacterium sp. A08 TaxID=2718532 RepID=UPI001420D16A|nr:Fe-S protein assembly co-chaperone HscB [Aquabacterium sp. A08]NIC43543.1 Fe-S protein assembly co-chaperone HscB [Aquabacterium sp. A08]
MNLQADDFTLFGLAPGFAVDRSALDERWKQLQRQVHPDRFATDGAAAQRVAMQWSVRINEAYQRLKDPLKRAAYWCELQGTPVNAESNTAMPAAFLMQQMEWREALDDAADEAALDALLADTRRARAELLQALEHCIDQQPDPVQAVQQVRALMFVERFAHEVHQRLDRL